MRTLLAVAATLALGLAACTEETAEPLREGDDAGAMADGAAGDLGGPAADAGPAADLAVPVDAAPVVDAEPPPAPDAGPPPPPPGSGCAEDDDCGPGASCLPDPVFPGGYCTQADCGDDAPCPEGATCIAGPFGPICAADCTQVDCREGYSCQDFSGQAVCMPGEDAGRVDGAPCERDEQCVGGACITDWPGGYCTTTECSTFEDCARGDEGEVDNRCFVNNRPTFCVRICQAPQDCREGYICQPAGQGLGICFPDPNEPLLDPADIADSPLGIQCVDADGSGRFELGYTVADDTTAYMMVPFSEDGQGLRPEQIAAPSGQVIDFEGRNAFQSAPAQLFGGLNPTVVPALDALADQLEAGDHRYRVRSDARRMCHYLLEEPSNGDQIDLNIYLVNIGVRAAQAEDNPNINAMLDQFEAVYAAAGIALGTVRFFDVEGALAERFQVIRSQDDVGNSLAITEPPGDTRDDVLSLNVVFIQTFALPGAGGVLGISPGLPGPAGLHGTPNSGVVFTAEFLGQRFRERSGAVVDGNLYTGNVLAHEVGHYLGLFHTTEQNQRSVDPIGDTPDCRGVNGFPAACPDVNNLMFPLAGADNSIVSAGQAAVIRANPLTKE